VHPSSLESKRHRSSVSRLAIRMFIGAVAMSCASTTDDPGFGAGGSGGTGGEFGGTSGSGGGVGASGGTGGGIGGTSGMAGDGGMAGSGGMGAVGGIAGSGGDAGASGTGGAPSCTGKPGVAGNATRSAAGTQYIVHGPAGLDGNTAVPLVFIAHGWTMSGALMQSITGYDAVADREKFIVVYPNGQGGNPWNVGNGACAPGSLVNNATADSFGYFEEMKRAIEADQCINPKQVFVAGFSMGGYFSNHMGCQKGNTFARAVGPHSGGTYPGACPAAPVPVFIMHGDADTFIHYQNCGGVARGYWEERNSCNGQRENRPVSGGTCQWSQGCDPNGQTVYCLFNGVGHAWAMGATEASWSFFKEYL
jgi:polyhydroxybutyrate depolymerase